MESKIEDTSEFDASQEKAKTIKSKDIILIKRKGYDLLLEVKRILVSKSRNKVFIYAFRSKLKRAPASDWTSYTEAYEYSFSDFITKVETYKSEAKPPRRKTK